MKIQVKIEITVDAVTSLGEHYGRTFNIGDTHKTEVITPGDESEAWLLELENGDTVMLPDNSFTVKV